MKIVSVVGARPNFIKHSSLSWHIRKEHEEILIHTDQHYDPNLSEIFFRELNIPKPDYNLNVGSGTHGHQTGEMLSLIESVMIREKPNMALVFGDTNTTLAGALAAAKLHIPIAHVEAGLRSFDKKMPEEINRILTDHISDLLFCPTYTAVKNLLAEGIKSGEYLVGDVMADTVAPLKGRPAHILKIFGVEPKEYSVLTIHRPENTDSVTNLKNIMVGISEYEKPIVFPWHPRTSEAMGRFKITLPKNVLTVLPAGYKDMITLMENADRIITDSGGIQKEAYMLGVPCITLRNTTEWVETVEAGWNILTGSSSIRIADAITRTPTTRQKQLFPIGASRKIVKILSKWEG